jgi:hypothetical protein
MYLLKRNKSVGLRGLPADYLAIPAVQKAVQAVAPHAAQDIYQKNNTSSGSTVAPIPVDVPISTALTRPTVPQTVSSAPYLETTTYSSVAPLTISTEVPTETFVETALGETNPLLKWGLLGLGAYIFLSSLGKAKTQRRSRRPRRRRSRKR